METVPIPLKYSRLAPLLRPVNAFLSAESAGGIVLLISTVGALIWANSPWGDSYPHFWHTKLAVNLGSQTFSMSLEHWVNDGLMAIFFLLVGLEIKRELLIGELASIRRAALPIAAAIGGVVVPALIYFSMNANTAGARGWGIPMATDIAFAVGVLALVGRFVPTSLKVFLLAVAIVDDLCAVVVIAIFYTSHISGFALTIAALFLLGLIALNVLRVHRPFPYMLMGVGLWAATLCSGIHATIAGVLLALTIPASRQIEELPYVAYMRHILSRMEREADIEPTKITEEQSKALNAMEEASKGVQTPLARVEHGLLRLVYFVIVPLFALANAGVDLRGGVSAAFQNPVMWGVTIGLIAGKPLGILLASWLSIKIGFATLPSGTTVRQLVGVSVLCGIGFTMSLFVSNLAFPGREDELSAAKVGILSASLIAGVAGSAILSMARSTGRITEQATTPAS